MPNQDPKNAKRPENQPENQKGNENNSQLRVSNVSSTMFVSRKCTEKDLLQNAAKFWKEQANWKEGEGLFSYLLR